MSPPVHMKTRYILLTAAKNEAAYIGGTIASVLQQSIPPIAWHIMDDGSTDQTAQIITDFAEKNPWIQLHHTPAGMKRDFGAQYRAIGEAYRLAATAEFEFVGVLDADITPQSETYYESILGMFSNNPKLGMTGGVVYERRGNDWKARKSNSADSVAGGIQMFRRSCFEQIGGYHPLKYGGSDWLAQIAVMAAGWTVEANPRLPVLHYRPSSSADGKWKGLFRAGLMDAAFDSHPAFELFKCARRTSHPPYLIGSALRFSGYLLWKLFKREILIPEDSATFLRAKQIAKLRSFSKMTALLEESP